MQSVAPALAGIGGGLQMAGTASSAVNESNYLLQQSRMATQQGFADEQMQRRNARSQLGEQAAAFGEAGGGYGGTVANVMRDSHTAAELDALNYRYRGLLKGWGYATEAKNDLSQAKYNVGAQLLNTGANMYRLQKQGS